MKTLFGKLVLILAILILTSSISAQWRLAQAPVKVDLNSGVQLTDTKAFVVGDNGIMLTTNNRGSTWMKIDLGVQSNLNSLKFIDDYTGFVVGDNGLILKTVSRWRDPEVLSVSSNYYNKDVSFSNELNGIVVGYKYLITPESPLSYATILVTHDGGLTWTDKSPMLTGKFNSVISFDKDKAIVVGDAGLVGFSNDRGENWYFRKLTTSNLNSVKVCKTTGLKIIVGDNGALFICKEEDRYRWIDCSISRFYDINSICQKDNNVFVIAGTKRSSLDNNIIDRSVILESKEISGHWSEVFTTYAGKLNSVHFCNRNSALAVGQKGTIAIYERVSIQDPIICSDSPKEILTQNYPNPFNPSTLISFKLPEQTNVELKIYDILGNEVATLINESKAAGNYEVEWNASNLPSGVYVYNLRVGSNVQMKKMLLLK
ncbi:MAG: T9SS type A sorting domain-containing protein [Ignavibacteriales bacterium]|nr:T9SS type A sorting domain-containing protein [Ignavibacteriales bacterium]